MTTVKEVPLTVSREAAEHLAQLGYQAEFDRMVDYIRQHVPGLLHLDVALHPPYDTGDEDAVVIEAMRSRVLHQPKEPTWNEWSRWAIGTFSPDINRHFTLLFVYGDENGR